MCSAFNVSRQIFLQESFLPEGSELVYANILLGEMLVGTT